MMKIDAKFLGFMAVMLTVGAILSPNPNAWMYCLLFWALAFASECMFNLTEDWANIVFFTMCMSAAGISGVMFFGFDHRPFYAVLTGVAASPLAIVAIFVLGLMSHLISIAWLRIRS